MTIWNIKARNLHAILSHLVLLNTLSLDCCDFLGLLFLTRGLVLRLLWILLLRPGSGLVALRVGVLFVAVDHLDLFQLPGVFVLTVFVLVFFVFEQFFGLSGLWVGIL